MNSTARVWIGAARVRDVHAIRVRQSATHSPCLLQPTSTADMRPIKTIRCLFLLSTLFYQFQASYISHWRAIMIVYCQHKLGTEADNGLAQNLISWSWKRTMISSLDKSPNPKPKMASIDLPGVQSS